MSRLTTSMSCAVTIQSAYTHDGDDVPCRTNARRSISIWITGSWRSYILLLPAVPRVTTTHGRKSRLSWRPTDSSTPSIPDTNLSMECPMPTRSRFWRDCKRRSHGSGNAPKPPPSPKSASAMMSLSILTISMMRWNFQMSLKLMQPFNLR